jgi:hypothetical protein
MSPLFLLMEKYKENLITDSLRRAHKYLADMKSAHKTGQFAQIPPTIPQISLRSQKRQKNPSFSAYKGTNRWTKFEECPEEQREIAP